MTGRGLGAERDRGRGHNGGRKIRTEKFNYTPGNIAAESEV